MWPQSQKGAFQSHEQVQPKQAHPPQPHSQSMTKHASKECRQNAIRWSQQGYTAAVIAEELLAGAYCERTVKNWVKSYRADGIIKPDTSRPWTKKRCFSNIAITCMLMNNILRADNGARAHEVQLGIWEESGETASLRSISRMMARHGWKDKVAGTVSARTNPVLKRLHARVRENYHPRQFLFADECLKRGKELRRRTAYGQWGDPSVVPLSPHLNRSWTIVACFDWTGFVDWKIQELAAGNPTSVLPETMDRRRWMSIFRDHILPHLQVSDGRRLARSVLVLDNCSLCVTPIVATLSTYLTVLLNRHWFSDDQRNQLIEEVEAAGAEVIFIPQYEPRANAIEGGFSQMNKFIAEDIALAQRNPERAINQALLRTDERYGTAFVRRSTKDVRKWL